MTVTRFEQYIGIDYSGANTPESRLSAIQVYQTDGVVEPVSVSSPASSGKRKRNWCRREVAEFLIRTARSGRTFVAGIDHGFSFPLSYFQKYGIKSWPDFLDDFCTHWPTIEGDVTVDSIRKQYGGPPSRTGCSKALRLAEKWTSSAKSVFLFDVQGSVAKSTHAGLPWLRHIRNELNGNVHFWPYDGWHIPKGTSVLAEVYPSIFRRRYLTEDRTVDQQDAYAVARWLADTDKADFLHRYLEPHLSKSDRAIADLEGWILGVA
jgi:hypothetical protein